MILNPTHRVLSTVKACNVRALLAGGQACILYGAAEFSRDSNFLVLADLENLSRLKKALALLDAEPVYLPPLEIRHLERGHACHFRCRHPEASGFRVDVMSRMRGVPGFSTVWRRRFATDVPGVGPVGVLSLPDLVTSKKTQRDKDWPMIRRLLEVDIVDLGRKAPLSKIRWWLRECRTPAYLADLVKRFPGEAARVPGRPWLVGAARDEEFLHRRLREEEDAVRREDRAYWEELEAMRRRRPSARRVRPPRPGSGPRRR